MLVRLLFFALLQATTSSAARPAALGACGLRTITRALNAHSLKFGRFQQSSLFSSSSWFTSSEQRLLGNRETQKAVAEERKPLVLVKNAAATKSSGEWTVLPDIWETLAAQHPNKLMLVDPSKGGYLTFRQGNHLIMQGAQALKKLGLTAGDCIAFFSENSQRWFITDQAVMKVGAFNAVRGSHAPTDELLFIYANSGSVALVVESLELLCNLAEGLLLNKEYPPTRFIIVLHPPSVLGEPSAPQRGTAMARLAGLPSSVPVFSFDEFLEYGELSEGEGFEPMQFPSGDLLATLVYTSGTTARPKGVGLTHGALLHQVKACTFSEKGAFNPVPGDTVLSILPVWHIFERTLEYCVLARGCKLIYSNLQSFKSDLRLWKPHYIFVVPRLIETMHKSIQSKLKKQDALSKQAVRLAKIVSRLYQITFCTWKNRILRSRPPAMALRLMAALATWLLWPWKKLADWFVWRKVLQVTGGRLKVLVSGGSQLPIYLDKFFDMIGLRLISGYGLTETGPVVCNRRIDSNVLGSVGQPISGVEVKVCSTDGTEARLPEGQRGLLFVKTPSIMEGYYQDMAATHEAFDSEGYFNTGDVAEIDPATKQIVITGRAKDTIVLSTGENVPPSPLEEAIVKSPLFDQAVVQGKDGAAYLSALLVLNVSELGKRGLVDAATVKLIDTELGQHAATQGPAGDVLVLRAYGSTLNMQDDVRVEVTRELAKCLAGKRAFERPQAFRVLLEPFSVQAKNGNGLLTQTLKLKRDAIAKKYAADINSLYPAKREAKR